MAEKAFTQNILIRNVAKTVGDDFHTYEYGTLNQELNMLVVLNE